MAIAFRFRTGRRQRAGIELAVVVQRQRGERDESGRDHVGGQSPLQERVQFARRGRGGIRADEIRRQPALAARQRAQQHCALRHARMPQQCGFDFAQLDAEAAHFHLHVGAAQIFEVAVRRAPREVAAFIKPRARFPRMRDETFRRQLRPPQIAAREARTADVEFARDADGAGREGGIEDEKFEVGNRHADAAAGGGVEVGARDRAVGHMHGRLGDAVHIYELRLRVAVPLKPRAQRRKIQRLAAEDDAA